MTRTYFAEGMILDTVAHELMKPKRWFDSHKLTQNLSKTKFVIFDNWSAISRKKLKDLDLTLEISKHVQRKSQQLSMNIKRWFQIRENKHNLRGTYVLHLSECMKTSKCLS